MYDNANSKILCKSVTLQKQKALFKFNAQEFYIQYVNLLADFSKEERSFCLLYLLLCLMYILEISFIDYCRGIRMEEV